MDLDAVEVRVLGLPDREAAHDAGRLSAEPQRAAHACNQSTNRDPVVAYDEEMIRGALHQLGRRRYTRLTTGHTSRAAKYRHLLDEALPLDRAEQAVLAVLLLRGEQTPGELKQRTERMQPFAGIDELQDVLTRPDRPRARRPARPPPGPEGGALPPPACPRISTRTTCPRAPVPPSPAAVVVPPPPRRDERLDKLEREVAELRAGARARCAPSSAREHASRSPPERLGAWLDALGGGARRRACAPRRRPGRVTFTGADGASVVLRAALPAARGPARRASRPSRRAPLLAHAARERVVGVLLVAARRLRGRGLRRHAGCVDAPRSATRLRRTARNTRAAVQSQQSLRAPPRGPGARRARRRGGRRGRSVLLAARSTTSTRVVLGGDRFALAAVLEDPRCAGSPAITSDRVLDVPDPRLARPARDAGSLPRHDRPTTLDPSASTAGRRRAP